jgi:hypothetical protein
MTDPQRNRSPFNRILIWTTATLGIVVVLVSVTTLASAIKTSKIAAQRTADKGHLKLLAVALHNYHETYGQFPPPFIADAEGRPMHSWRVLLLPFLFESKLYEQYRFTEPWNSPHNRQLEFHMPSVFAFHGTNIDATTTTNILAVVGPETVWPANGKRTLEDLQDGQPNTILVVENEGAGIHWMEPRDLAFQNMDFHVNHPAGISCRHLDPLVSSADGDIKPLQKDITPATVRALLTINGHEPIQEETNRNWLPLNEESKQ